MVLDFQGSPTIRTNGDAETVGGFPGFASSLKGSGPRTTQGRDRLDMDHVLQSKRPPYTKKTAPKPQPDYSNEFEHEYRNMILTQFDTRTMKEFENMIQTI